MTINDGSDVPKGGSVTGARRRFRLARVRRGSARLLTRRSRGYVVRAGLSVVALVAVAAAVAALGALAAPLPEPPGPMPTPAVAEIAALPVPVPEKRAAPPAVPQLQQAPAKPTQPQQRQPQRPAPQVSFVEWSAEMSGRTGIPARALQAYAHAHAVITEIQPECQLTWVTLAGIARIESHHGHYQGRTLNDAGLPSSPIIGIPLNGSGNVKAIGDTDGGALDGDPRWDRAVGPFQFIPSTWARWRSDGDGNGVGNPQDIDDSAVAAARYLCASGGDLATGDGWLNAVLAYNHSMSYAQQVYSSAVEYARRSQG